MVDLNIQKLIDDVIGLFGKKTKFVQDTTIPTISPIAPSVSVDIVKPEISTKDNIISSSFQAPLKGSYENSGDYSPNAPTDFRHKSHKGVDLRAPGGSSVYPITEGIVSNIGSGSSGGNMVYIQHPNNIKTYSAHLGTIKVHKGDKVTKDTIIGTVGDSGNAKGTAPHVHFQVWQDGQLQNPNRYFTVPKYSDLKPQEKVWQSEEAKNEAKLFNVNKHIKQNKQAFSNDIKKLEKIANYYNNIY